MISVCAPWKVFMRLLLILGLLAQHRIVAMLICGLMILPLAAVIAAALVYCQEIAVSLRPNVRTL